MEYWTTQDGSKKVVLWPHNQSALTVQSAGLALTGCAKGKSMQVLLRVSGNG